MKISKRTAEENRRREFPTARSLDSVQQVEVIPLPVPILAVGGDTDPYKMVQNLET
jgi:hypothetical protein